MSDIRILPDRVANQIAAGEVIERPVGVVKELVENSLDAGATRIQIEFRNGGKSYIRVDDNGCGMSPDDGLLALERHATSKIRRAEDLTTIGTYGFRGEALPSVASISRFTMRSRTEKFEHGTEILINSGKHIHRKECGMPVGTSIEVAHLFGAVPARRKFLKTENTEGAHIVHLARLYALANPETSFTLLENGRTVFKSPRCTTLEERIGEVFGRRMAKDLIEIEAGGDEYRLHGLIGRPGVGRSTRQEMVTYVNRRPVESKMIHFSLIEAYHTYVPRGRYPLAFLFIRTSPARVDVNVHPAKREVRFREEGRIRHFIISNVLDRLREERAEPPGGAAAADDLTASLVPPPRAVTGAPPSAPAVQGRKLSPIETASAAPVPIARPEFTAGGKSEAAEAGAPPKGALNWRFLGVAHENYAVYETGAGLVLLNRRGALERILFERILKRLEGAEVIRQQLLFPAPLELDPLRSAALSEHLPFLRAKGFDIERFGRNFFRVEAVPDWLDPSRAEEFVRDLMGLLRERGLHPERPDLAHERIAKKAAAMAARVPSAPGDREMKALAMDLMACENPLTDPQGNATYYEIALSDLERRFGRRSLRDAGLSL